MFLEIRQSHFHRRRWGNLGTFLTLLIDHIPRSIIPPSPSEGVTQGGLLGKDSKEKELVTASYTKSVQIRVIKVSLTEFSKAVTHYNY